MKKILVIAWAAIASFASQAVAADLPARFSKAPPALPAVANWTGCYLGGGFGYGTWTQDLQARDLTGLPAGTSNTNGGRGWAGTVQGGCDYQFGSTSSGSLVIGAFGDYDWTGYKGVGVISAAALVPGDVRGNENMSSAWAAGGRIGWVPAALPQLMVFVSGGFTQANFDRTDLFYGFTGAPEGTYLAAHTYNGYFIGSGYEYGIGFLPGLFWKTEYRWSDFSTDHLPELSSASGLPNGFTKDSHEFVQTIRSELIWRFNWSGPVVAKY
jgi:outer membrane immunogenic protein